MVYWTAHKQPAANDGSILGNEMYRVHNGFKELHVHNPPPRKNLDFKPMLFGDFRGMPNFKLSEPWSLFRNLGDLWHEDHQKPIIFIKSTLRGAICGFAFYLFQNASSMGSSFVDKKLHLTENSHLAFFKNFKVTMARAQSPVLRGAGIFLAYSILYEFFTHHKEAMDVPDIITHYKIWTVLTPILISIYYAPKFIYPGYFVALGLVFPMFYSIKMLKAGDSGSKHSYYWYQDGVSQAEKAKFEYQDKIEMIGFARQNDYAFGATRHKNFKGQGSLY
jgi:hypothetical protein